MFFRFARAPSRATAGGPRRAKGLVMRVSEMTKSATLLFGTTCFVASLSAMATPACSSGPDGAGPGGVNAPTRTDDSIGGSSSTGAGTVTTKTGLPCDVDAVLKARCQTCHGAQTQYGATSSLVTYDDLVKDQERVRARIKDDTRPMPPTPNARLTAAEIATLDGWFAAGAKPSSEACTTDKPDDGVKPLSCKPDTILKAAAPFTVQQGGSPDQYVCFGVEVNLTKKRHITALAPHTDNKKVLHHILLFQSPQAESPQATPCAAFGSASWKLVAGWAPGGANVELPPEAGYPEEKGTTHWVVQLHYNNAANLAGQVDQSGYEMCTTEDLRPNDAGVLAFGSTKFTIPPRSTTTLRCDYKLDQTFANVKFFNGSPHMHNLGTAMSTERIPGGNGTPEKVLDQPGFDFSNQANFPVKASVNPGDVMRTRCTWKNPGDTSVGFGEGTADEMCFDFLSYYPNIPDKTFLGAPIFTWITPSLRATCTTE
jgi:hypothetical protein